MEHTEVEILRAAKDNYIYLIKSKESNDFCAIDPTSAEPVIHFLDKSGGHLDLILNTHHHHDHVGGNLELSAKYRCPIYCSSYDIKRIPGASKGLSEGQEFKWGGHQIRVWENPGHTLGAITYLFSDSDAVFTGDTLFTLGCGRLFEGSAQQLYTSLQRFLALPDNVKVYSGHEYGLNNGQFALWLRPEDTGLKTAFGKLESKIEGGGRSVPSTMEFERAHNPFLTARNLEEFARIRHLKDNFTLEPNQLLR